MERDIDFFFCWWHDYQHKNSKGIYRQASWNNMNLARSQDTRSIFNLIYYMLATYIWKIKFKICFIATANTDIWYIGKLLKVNLKSYHKEYIFHLFFFLFLFYCQFVRRQKLAEPTVVIILQYIYPSLHADALNLKGCM